MPLNWPAGLDRTDPGKRESTNKFSAGARQTKRELKRQLEMLNVDSWTLDTETGSGGDPGVVLRWEDDGTQRYVACDTYTNRKSNLRELFLWLKEMRMQEKRPVSTPQSAFAAAELPAGDDDAIVMDTPPHEVLGVQPDADEQTVKAVYQVKVKDAHPDNGGTQEELSRVKRAKEAMLS